MMLHSANMQIPTCCHAFCGVVCAGAVILTITSAQARNLFVSDTSSNVYEFAPDGTRSTFASGMAASGALAFNSKGDLFVADLVGGAIYEFTPDGTRTTFASGLPEPTGLAFNSAGDLFVADQNNGSIYELTPDGGLTTFASGLQSPDGLAFDSAGYLFVADWISTYIYEFTTNGTRTTFASEGVPGDFIVSPFALAF